jgi:hypothetical protein
MGRLGLEVVGVKFEEGGYGLFPKGYLLGVGLGVNGERLTFRIVVKQRMKESRDWHFPLNMQKAVSEG